MDILHTVWNATMDDNGLLDLPLTVSVVTNSTLRVTLATDDTGVPPTAKRKLLGGRPAPLTVKVPTRISLRRGLAH